MNHGSFLWTAILASGMCAAPACAAIRYQGEARSLHGKHRLLYTERQYLYRNHGQKRRLTLYLCPDGGPFARKTVDYAPGDADPDFALVDAQSGYEEGVRGTGKDREVYVRSGPGEKTRSTPLPEAGVPVIDAGFDGFLVSNWDALVAGKHKKIDFLVPSRQRFMGFKVERVKDHAGQGETAFRLRVNSWLGFMLPHIDVVYDNHTRRLKSFRGISNLRDADGDNVEVDIEYPVSQRQEVPQSAIQQALDRPLSGHCPLG